MACEMDPFDKTGKVFEPRTGRAYGTSEQEVATEDVINLCPTATL